MGKMKTKKSAAKRFKRTGSGKLMHSGPGQNHACTVKDARRMRRLRQKKELTDGEKKKIEKLLPND